MSDHFEVCQSLKDLSSPNAQRRLGEGGTGTLVSNSAQNEFNS